MNLSSIVQQLESEQQHQAVARPTAAASSTGSAAASSSTTPATGEATITADDFLQLLVSELQNQDPTADTDPNEYVNQLVNVNSLQQLISINQEVGDITPSSNGSGAASSSVSNALAGAPASSLAVQTANARTGYTAFASQAASAAASSPASLPAPDRAAGVFDDIASQLANPAISAEWQPKSSAVH